MYKFYPRICELDAPITQILRVMKITVLFIFLAILHVHANVYGQKLTLKQKKVSIARVFEEIEKQTGYDVFYSPKIIQTKKTIDANFQETPIDQVLKFCLADQPVTYIIEEKTIVIREKGRLAQKLPTNANSENSKDDLQQIEVRGRVADSLGNPLEGATVKVKGKDLMTSTNSNGEFSLRNVPYKADLEVTYLGYIKIVIIARSNVGNIILKMSPSTLDEIEVKISTGYQQIPKERATGSFDLIDNELLNRSVSPDFLSRLENLSPGLQFNKGDAAETDPFLIRGRSTITADAQPLIVLNDFPYDGDLSNINPNDIESVSVLKDAAAASIWGARAANGVIVITTKKGKTAKPRIELNSNVTLQAKPDVYNVSWMTSADRVDWERMLFDQGYYDGAKLGNTLARRVSPIPEAVELMIANDADLPIELEKLRQYDARKDIERYFYQNSVNQQYNLNISGAQDKLTYFFSAGYDANRSNLVGQNYERISLRNATTYRLTDKLQLQGTMQYIQSTERTGDNPGMNTGIGYGLNGLSPYTRLVDENGVAQPYHSYYRKAFIDTAGSGNFLDWNFRPYDEIRLQRTSDNIRDILVNATARYEILKGLQAEILYQYQFQQVVNQTATDELSFTARNRINRFTQINSATGTVTYPVPLGGMLQTSDNEIRSHQGRAQLNFNRSWHDKHNVDAIAGVEIRSKATDGMSYFYYGYRPQYNAFNVNVDFVNTYPLTVSTGNSRIPSGSNGLTKLTDNFFSLYANGAYTYDSRYTFSASMRKDEANLFGVSSNMRGTPLWSIGAKWQLNRESWYTWDWLPVVNPRVTYGVNGNISRAASALTTAYLYSGGTTHRYPTATVVRPPNDQLRWERVKMLILGLDFSLKGSVLSGSIEYYDKTATDLLAQTPTDPTLGFSSVFANVASMKGKGWDIQLNSLNIKKALRWQSNLIYSYAANKVTEYLMPVSSVGRSYLTGLTAVQTIIGMPLYTAYSFAWAGLDPETGAPRSYLNGEISTDYNAIYNTTSLDGLQCHGPVQPVHYGALRNTFSFRQFTLSFNISYKFGYYFRVPTVINNAIVGGWDGHGDYALRWQKPGDEQHTHVPTMIYPANVNRDNVYRYASVHILKGDHIRLEDVNISYTLQRSTRLPFQSMRVFVYAANLPVLWTANSRDIDPYFNNVPRTAASFALGMNLTL